MYSFAQPSFSCIKVFTTTIEWNSSLQFSQKFIGKKWALRKLERILREYDLWQEQNPFGKISDFVLWRSKAKPAIVVRNVDGQLMLVDKHNVFYAYTQIVGEGTAFQIHTSLKMDYSEINRATGNRWTKQEMMQDLINKDLVDLTRGKKLTYEDLLSIPRNITDLEDNPMRSFVSFLFNHFPIRLKGSDFLPHIQNQFGEELKTRGLGLMQDSRFTTSDLFDVKKKILESPELIQFLLDRLNPDLAAERYQRVYNSLVVLK